MPEVWDKLSGNLALDTAGIGSAEYLEPGREAVLRHLAVDIRVLSYDMFCSPPDSIMHTGATTDWWTSMDGSTPSRMWRQRNAALRLKRSGRRLMLGIGARGRTLRARSRVECLAEYDVRYRGCSRRRVVSQQLGCVADGGAHLFWSAVRERLDDVNSI
jgi:hypothetical protein